MTVETPVAGPSHGFFSKNLISMARIFSVFALLAILGYWARPIPLDIWIGLPLVAAGGLLRAWSAGYLLKTRQLAVAGPYAFTRNPLYLGRLLLFTGFAVMATLPTRANLIILAGGIAIFFFYYMPRKERIECARLLQTHGEEYARYKAAVPALFPRLTPYRGSDDAGSGWHWSRFNRNREYMMLIVEAGLVALFAVRAFGWS